MKAEKDRTGVGALIKRLRRSSGMTQTQLAAKLHVSYQQVQKYEKGRSELTLRRLKQMAEALDVPADILLMGFHNADGRDEEMEVMALYRRIEDRCLRRAAKKVLSAFAGRNVT